jgi:membrane protease YdiL (CAAX protease family)
MNIPARPTDSSAREPLSAVREAAFLAAITAVPAFSSQWRWPTVLVVVVCMGFVRRARIVGVLLAYLAPVAAGLPWSVPAIAAAAAWTLLGRARRRHPRSGSPEVHRSSVVTEVARYSVPALIGIAGGLVVCGVDHDRIFSGSLKIAAPPPHTWVLAVVVVAVAAVNASAEELLWRWVVDSAAPPRGAAIAYGRQSLSFGLAHVHGIPGGPAGMAAAGCYSALLYAVRRRAGLPSAVVAHFLTDLIVFWFVARNATYVWPT